MGTGGLTRKKISLRDYQIKVGNTVSQEGEFTTYTFVQGVTHTIDECLEIIFEENDALIIFILSNITLEGKLNISVPTTGFTRIRNLGTFTTTSTSEIVFGDIITTNDQFQGIGIGNFRVPGLLTKIIQEGFIEFGTITTNSSVNINKESRGILNGSILNEKSSEYEQTGDLEIKTINFSTGVENFNDYNQTGNIFIKTVEKGGSGILNRKNGNYIQNGNTKLDLIITTDEDNNYSTGIRNENSSEYELTGDILINTVNFSYGILNRGSHRQNGNVQIINVIEFGYGITNDTGIYNQNGNVTFNNITTEIKDSTSGIVMKGGTYNQKGNIVFDKIYKKNAIPEEFFVLGIFCQPASQGRNNIIWNQKGNITFNTIENGIAIYNENVIEGEEIKTNQYKNIIINNFKNSIGLWIFSNFGGKVSYTLKNNASITLKNGSGNDSFGIWLYRNQGEGSEFVNNGIVNLGTTLNPLAVPYGVGLPITNVDPTKDSNFNSGTGIYVGYS